MKEIISNLLKLKSIVTLIVVISYTIMVFMGIVEPDYKDLVIMKYHYLISECLLLYQVVWNLNIR